MKKVLLGTLAVLTLAACSKDEVVQQNPNDAISFTATTGKAVSRAADGYCNEAKPGEFDVWAKVGATNYFAKTNYSLQDGTWKITDSNVRYWPDGAVDFFAAKNYNGAATPTVQPAWNATVASPESPLTITGYQVEAEPGDQKDFIYAVNMGATKATATAPLNFRHALSQIEFMAQNENKNIYVTVQGVKVVNVKNTGNFAFPINSTDDKVGVHNGGAYDNDFVGKHQGKWTGQSGTATYTIKTKNAADTDNADVKLLGRATEASSLTVSDPTGKEYNSQTLYVMPQNVDVWDGTGTPLDAKNTGDGDPYTKHAYFVLNCKIWNVAAGDGTEDTSGVQLWNGTQDIAVCIPAGTIWEQGKRYVYTFKFTKNGNGGIDPSGNPVFTPIKLSVTVDDFVKGTEPTVEMKDPTIP